MTDAISTVPLLSPLHAGAAMREVVSDRARLQRMLDFEAALARAEAAVGVVTPSAAVEIAEACRVERYEVASIMEAAAEAGDLAIPLVNAITIELTKRNKSSAGFVNWGATSQDILDTALVLELRAAIDALTADLDIAIRGFTTLAGRHRRTLSVARTQMQHALPMPFGLRLAGYAAALARSRDRLWRLRREALALQFGGGAGTLAALGEHGLEVAERVAALLDLPLPDAPWHSHRDRLAEVAAAFGVLAGTCGKIARDVALMMQVEVGEASEGPAAGRGASLTLPHKRNPAAAAIAVSAAAIAPNLVATILTAQTQEYERGLGGLQTEWATFPALELVTSGALTAVAEIAEGLEIDVERLRANLEASGGQIMAEAVAFALATKVGRQEAQRIVQDLSQRARKENKPLKELTLTDLRVKSHFGAAEIEKLFIPLTYQGSSQVFIDRLVMSSQTRGGRRIETRAIETRLSLAAQIAPSESLEPAQSAARAEEAPPAVIAEPAPAERPPAPPITAPPPMVEPISIAQPPAPLAAEPAPPPPEPVEFAEPAPEMPPPPLEALSVPLPPEPSPTPPPLPEDAPGAFLEVLSRAEAEAAAAQAARKPKPN
jgi:3-carboxy-cis,cis-muconate cycloisomerase